MGINFYTDTIFSNAINIGSDDQPVSEDTTKAKKKPTSVCTVEQKPDDALKSEIAARCNNHAENKSNPVKPQDVKFFGPFKDIDEFESFMNGPNKGSEIYAKRGYATYIGDTLYYCYTNGVFTYDD